MFSALNQRPVMRQSLVSAVVVALALAACNGDSDTLVAGSDGPHSAEAPVVHATGDVALGKQVFRFETFGNERFWTDAVRLQQGVVAAGVTLGRAPTGLTPFSTEAQVDAYLNNPAFYPVNTFDDTPDGNGDGMHNPALFRTDLSAPWGTEGSIAKLDNFTNLVYTAVLDPTNLTSAGGRAFLRKLGGTAAGDEVVDGYIQVLAATGVSGYPYLQASAHPAPGTEEAPIGIRVDNTNCSP